MNYLEVLCQEYLEYKKNNDLNPLNLLNFAYDIAYSEGAVNKGVLRELKQIENKTCPELNVSLAIAEFIYQKNKGARNTSAEIIYTDMDGNKQFVFFAAFIRGRISAIKEINRITGIILRQYDFRPPINTVMGAKKEKIKGMEEII